MQHYNELLKAILLWPGALIATNVMQSPWVTVGDFLAVAVCAITGVLVAQRKQMDLVGVTVISVVSGLGGGTLRDLLVGAPVFWVVEPQEVLVTMVAGWSTYALCRQVHFKGTAFLVPDALGLALFTVIGTEKTLATGHGWLVAAMMGVITGTFGGVLRDVLCNDVPGLFIRTELYATAALVGALGFIVCWVSGLPGWNCALAGFSLVTGLRLAAVRWRWTAPSFT